MSKAPDAFRTISEVAEQLDTPPHVLRFWESKFTQVRPVKRAGGRRYYRPADVALLGGIKKLLHEDGLTIRGVKKVLSDKGVRHVAALADPGYDAEGDADSAAAAAAVANEATAPQDADVAAAPQAVAVPPEPPAPPPAEVPAPPRTAVGSTTPLPRPQDLSGLASMLRRLSPGAVERHRQSLRQASSRLSALLARRGEGADATRR